MFCDLAVMLADGARWVSDLQALRGIVARGDRIGLDGAIRQ
jgi:hypothetical protein